ncbi:acyl-homoserine-lactone synthase [Rhizorhapis suberifaciens]|uniref:Acyl-homoserine lactone synthase n=1 Tax=Rhizorhapis suberifaciens TaxID=13656 RepID=A0A840HYB0_9SPHN|nr:acyl-homoserine-lactone synthase [Rhizorhapis suberifaciens]MBB4642641.1 acyl-homoserine lactone synthase [Rhizorhapis suberifaciens]
MVCIINGHEELLDHPLVRAMYKDRKRVFIDLLGWDLPRQGEFEHDAFDDENAVYLVVADPITGDHLASLRLLRTDRPHLMSEVFPQLSEGPVPGGVHIREITRLCLSPRLRAAERIKARNALAKGLIEYALLMDISALTGLSEIKFLSEILSAGWRCMPLGLPQVIDGSVLGAFQIDVTPETLRQLRQSWRCDVDHPLVFDIQSPLAA